MRSRCSVNRNVVSPVWTKSGQSDYVPDRTHRAKFHNICIRGHFPADTQLYILDGIFLIWGS